MDQRIAKTFVKLSSNAENYHWEGIFKYLAPQVNRRNRIHLVHKYANGAIGRAEHWSFYTRQYMSVILNNYNSYPKVEITTSTSVRSIIYKLDSMFAFHGIPNKIKSDEE